MTPEQFELVAEQLRSMDPVRSAAREVLVGGLTNAEAIDGTSVTHQSITNTLGRFRKAHQKLEEAYNEGIPNDVEMTRAQFEVLAELMRALDTPVKTAAMRVLAEGISNAEAIAGTAISHQSITNALTRYRRTHKRVAEVYGKKARARKPVQKAVVPARPLTAAAHKVQPMRMQRVRVKKTK